MRYLNIGCGKIGIPGWVNVDLRGGDIRADILNLPFQSNSFDGAYASHILEHIVDIHRAMHEIHRVLKPDARILIRVPYGLDGLFDPNHVHAFDFSTFRRFETDNEQSLEYGKIFKIEKIQVTDYHIPFEYHLKKIGFLRFLNQRFPDRRIINPFPLTKRKELSCILRTLKSM